jgi:conjugative transposon TraN protein
MKPITLFLGTLLLTFSCFCQIPQVGITTQKTTCLVFPYPIKHVDRGTKDILAQQVNEAENILLIKAADAHFPETNLSVVTSDGSLYSFAIRYDSTPLNWVYRLPVQTKATVGLYASSLLDNPRTVHGIRDISWKVQAKVTGLYIKEETIYYQLEIINNSALDYDINYLRFFIRNKRKAKRTSMQEIEVRPQCIAGNPTEIKAHSHLTLVVALEKLTLPEKKYLAIEIGEKNGGRNLLLKVGNRKIIRAKTLPDHK